MTRPLKIAMLCIDAREAYKEYARPGPYFGTAPAALLEGLSRLQEVELHVISCMQQPMACPEALAPNIWYHGLLVPKFGWLRTAYQGCIRAVRRKLEELQPDLVHAQGTERECGMCGAFSGRPNVLTLHGNMRALARTNRAQPFSFEWLAARLESVALSRTWGVFCNSRHTEALVRPAARKVWRVPNPVSSVFFSPARRRPVSPPVLVNVGSVVPNKRQVEVLSMARALYSQGLKFQLQVVGPVNPGSPYGADFRRRIEEAESTGYGQYLGQKTPGELVDCLDAASAIVHAPKEEAFGLVVAEGLARNLKLFAFSNGGVKDIAAGAEGAELLDEGDWTGMAQAIQSWLANRAPRPTQAATLMEARYHPEVIARLHLEIYRELLAMDR